MRLLFSLVLAAFLLSGCPNLTPGGMYVAPASYDALADGEAKADAGAKAGVDTTVVPIADVAVSDVPIVDVPVKQDVGAKVDTKTPAATSCKGKCGAKYNPKLSCQCNADCAKFGNCCSDYAPQCQPGLASCKGRCGEIPQKGDVCQCSWSCGRYGSCCPDFIGLCAAGQNLDTAYADATEQALCNKPANLYNVEYAKDGDTIQMVGGDIIRYLIVNTPELSKKDCYAYEAWQWTKALVKKVKTVCLRMDPNEGDKDQYNRLLRYVFYLDPAGSGKWINMNLMLVRLGYGPVFYPYATGQKWEKLGVLMQQKARQTKSGGWGKCGWH